MSEMIERVAKALFLSQHPDAEWSSGRARIKWFHMAEAAIQAMREPTEPMIAAGITSAEQCTFNWTVGAAPCVAEHAWEAMIDEALK